MSAAPERDRRASFLADPALASQLARFVRTRVPPSEVDDIVQSTLADALASASAPENDAELKPWLFGIARNKVADHFRRTRREVPREPTAVEEVAAASAPQSAEDLLHWAQRELPAGDGAESTLEWMLREGAGEKLETIAAEENVPAPRVRQRVARLRKHFRAKWAAQLAAAALLVVLALAIWAVWRQRGNDIAIPEPPRVPSAPTAPVPPPVQTPEERAAELRRDAFEACDAKDWKRCLEGLDAAKNLDAAGDDAPRVQRARKDASDALIPPVPPVTKDSPETKGKITPPAPSTVAPPVTTTPMTTPPPPQSTGTPAPQKPQPKASPSPKGGTSDFGDPSDTKK